MLSSVLLALLALGGDALVHRPPRRLTGFAKSSTRSRHYPRSARLLMSSSTESSTKEDVATGMDALLSEAVDSAQPVPKLVIAVDEHCNWDTERRKRPRYPRVGDHSHHRTA